MGQTYSGTRAHGPLGGGYSMSTGVIPHAGTIAGTFNNHGFNYMASPMVFNAPAQPIQHTWHMQSPNPAYPQNPMPQQFGMAPYQSGQGSSNAGNTYPNYLGAQPPSNYPHGPPNNQYNYPPPQAYGQQQAYGYGGHYGYGR